MKNPSFLFKMVSIHTTNPYYPFLWIVSGTPALNYKVKYNLVEPPTFLLFSMTSRTAGCRHCRPPWAGTPRCPCSVAEVSLLMSLWPLSSPSQPEIPGCWRMFRCSTWCPAGRTCPSHTRAGRGFWTAPGGWTIDHQCKEFLKRAQFTKKNGRKTGIF
jgi:hypothetical protein